MKNRILIVDDSKSWIVCHKELIHKFFSDKFEIVTAISANEALNIIEADIDNPFSLIITDLQMEYDYEPKLAGEWLIEQIQSKNALSCSKILIISAMNTIKQIAEKYNADYIPKSTLIQNVVLLKQEIEKILSLKQ